MANVSATGSASAAPLPRRTDCTEEIGIIVTLVGRLARSRSTSSPLADEAVLLTDAGLVLEPDFDRGFLR
jgi:hypothetical protein